MGSELKVSAYEWRVPGESLSICLLLRHVRLRARN